MDVRWSSRALASRDKGDVVAFFTLAVAAFCGVQGILRAIQVWRRRGDAYLVVLLAGMTICMLAVSLNLPPVGDLLPVHPRVEASLGMAVIGALVVLVAPFASLAQLAVRAFRERRTVRE